jgi:conjugal transfer pilus assembly protein TraF
MLLWTAFPKPVYAEEDKNEEAILRPYYFNHEEGWFWYIDPPKPEKPLKPKKTKEKLESEPKSQKIEPKGFRSGWPEFHTAEDIHAYAKRLMDRAVMDPTPEKVKKYLVFQKYILSRSRLFTDVATRVIWDTPELDQAAEKPRADIARTVLARVSQQDINRRLAKASRLGGVFFFFSSICPYCRLEAPILKRLEETYGIKVIPVSIDGGGLPEYPHPILDNGIAAALNISVTPTLFFGVPPKQMQRIANGFITMDELQERILSVAEAGGAGQ